MRAGKLQHRIQIEREHTLVADSGLSRKEWLPILTSRAELKQASTDEFLAGPVEMDSNRAVFVIRFPLVTITTADRIMMNGTPNNTFGIAELGLRRRLEVGAASACATFTWI